MKTPCYFFSPSQIGISPADENLIHWSRGFDKSAYHARGYKIGQFRSQWSLITIWILFLLIIVRSTKGENITSFCKCSCIGKPPEIIPLSQTNANSECANCTRAFCEEQLGKDFCGLKTREGNPIDDNSCGTEFTATCTCFGKSLTVFSVL